MHVLRLSKGRTDNCIEFKSEPLERVKDFAEKLQTQGVNVIDDE